MMEPLKRLFRPAPPLTKPILVNSLPKSGTHLLTTMLSQLPGVGIKLDLTSLDKLPLVADRAATFAAMSYAHRANPGIWVTHLPHDAAVDPLPGQQDFHSLFIYRDPRDVLVSLFHYVRKHRGAHIYSAMLDPLSDEQALMLLIRGTHPGRKEYVLNESSIPALNVFVRGFAGWIHSKNALVMRFEDLIGPQADQRVHQLGAYLGLSNRYTGVLKKGIGNADSPTFRRSEIGTWKAGLSAGQIEAIEALDWSGCEDFFWHG